MSHWETRKGTWTHYVSVDACQETVGEHAGSGHTDQAGACSHAEFLAGRYQDDIRATHGEDVLRAVIATVRGSPDNPAHAARRGAHDNLRAALEALPHDPALAEQRRHPDTRPGAYGNLGGYRTEIVTGTHRLDYARDTGTLTRLKDGHSWPVTFPGHASEGVGRDGDFLVCVNQSYATIAPDGTVALAPGARGISFGTSLRIGRVHAAPEMLILDYHWVGAPFPPGLLRFSFGAGLIARWPGRA